MIDIESTVFDRIAKAFDAAYPNGSRYGEATATPATFPCVTLVEADNYTYEQSPDEYAWLMYEVNVYSNKVSGAKQECKAVMDLVDNEMIAMGFARMFCNQTKNSENQIYRMTARYRAVISKEHRIYKK